MSEYADKDMRWAPPKRDRWARLWGRAARKDVSRDGLTHGGAFAQEKPEVVERCKWNG